MTSENKPKESEQEAEHNGAEVVWDEPLCPKCDETVLKTFNLEGTFVDKVFDISFKCEKCGHEFKQWFIIRSVEKPGTETYGGCVEEAGILYYASKDERASYIAQKAVATRKANQRKAAREAKEEAAKAEVRASTVLEAINKELKGIAYRPLEQWNMSGATKRDLNAIKDIVDNVLIPALEA